MMSDFTIKDMLTMQRTLQEKYKDKWETICPEAGKHKLLWLLGEVGEVIDIIKKNGDQKAVEDLGHYRTIRRQRWRMPFLPSASCRNLDLPPVNLRFLQSHLTKNAFAIAPTHLCGIALDLRQHLVEEMADVLMYYNDVLLCYGISEQELKEAYIAKFEKNMTRW